MIRYTRNAQWDEVSTEEFARHADGSLEVLGSEPSREGALRRLTGSPAATALATTAAALVVAATIASGTASLGRPSIWPASPTPAAISVEVPWAVSHSGAGAQAVAVPDAVSHSRTHGVVADESPARCRR
jgi:hypothetical protein